MTLPTIYPITRKKVLVAAAVLSVIVAAEVFLMREIKAASADLQQAKQELMVNKLAEASKEYAISQFSSKMGADSIIIPSEAETVNKFYSHLLAMLANRGYKDAEVTKASEENGLVSFKVNGVAEYGGFMNLVASFCQGSFVMRLSELHLEGMGDNLVKYSFTVTARTAQNAASGDVNENQQ